VKISITDLSLDPKNARKHSARNLEAIATSLEKFGQRKPIVVHRGVVLAGNGTLEAARSLGWTEIDVAEVPDDWDMDTAKAYALADNRTAELAEWDEGELAKQLLELDEKGWNIEELGFKQREIEKSEPIDQDDVPDTPLEPITKLGNIYQLGNHRLVCGDSTDAKTLSKALDGHMADCIFTDPPYNVAYQGGTKDKLTIKNDSMSEAEFENFLLSAYEAMYANVKEGGAIYVCHADGSSISFRAKFIESGFMLKQILIWVKDNFTLSRQDYNWQHEPIIYGWKPGSAHTWYGPFSDSTVQEFNEKDIFKMNKEQLVGIIEKALQATTIIKVDRPRRNAEHPTMKPIELVTRLVANSAKRGMKILDPFGGSGSTLIACEALGMKAALVELDPKYCDVIVTRWENLTGLKAELVNVSN
jgi:DNA modification methylase